MSVAFRRLGLVLVLITAGLLVVIATTDRPSSAVTASGRTWVIDAVDDPYGNRWVSANTGTGEVTVEVGDTVEWQFDQAVTDHDLTSQDTRTAWQPAVQQWRAANGEPVRYTFTRPGTYDYLCSIHGVVMHGSVVVVAPDPENRQPTVAPMADVTAGPAPLTARFMAMASDLDGDPLSYHWDFGNGTSSTEENPSAGYPTPGSYTAVVEVSDGRGGTARGELSISVTGGDAPVVTVAATPASGAAPLDVVLTAEAVDPQGDRLDYAWDLGDGSDATGTRVEHTYRAEGVRVATVRVTDSDGNVGTGTVTVVVGDIAAMLPDIAATATPGSGTAPLQVAFSAEVSTAGSFSAFADGLTAYPGLTGHAGLTRARGLARAWLDVTGLRPGAPHLVHVHEQACSASNGGPHFRFDTSLPFGEANEIWLPFAADAEGRSGRVEATRPMRAGAAAVSMVIHDPDNPAKRIGCVDLAPSTADLTYTWDFGDGALGGGPDPDHVYAAPGTYSATLTVSNGHEGHHEAGHQGSVTRSVRVVVAATADRIAPRTSILGGATGVVRARQATFRLGSDEPGVSYSCRLDGAAWRACVSPVGYRGLRDGVHRLEVRARDRAGNSDSTSAIRTWTVDTRRPVVGRVRPGRTVRHRTPTIRARVRDAHLLPGSAGLVLRVDGRLVRASQLRIGRGRVAWTPRRPMALGGHVVRLTVVDAAGNRTTVVQHFRLIR